MLDVSEFLVKFLHLSSAVLLKTNVSANGSLLNVAMTYRDVTAVREIINCWITFLTTIPVDAHGHIYQDNAMIPKTDLLLLSCLYPQEFELLISSLILIPVPNNELRVGTKYLKGEKMYLGVIEPPTSVENKKSLSKSKSSLLGKGGRLKKNAVSPLLRPPPGSEAKTKTPGKRALPQPQHQSQQQPQPQHKPHPLSSLHEGLAAGMVQQRALSADDLDLHNGALENKHLKNYKYYFLPLPGLVDINMLRAYTMTASGSPSVPVSVCACLSVCVIALPRSF